MARRRNTFYGKHGVRDCVRQAMVLVEGGRMMPFIILVFTIVAVACVAKLLYGLYEQGGWR